MLGRPKISVLWLCSFISLGIFLSFPSHCFTRPNRSGCQLVPAQGKKKKKSKPSDCAMDLTGLVSGWNRQAGRVDPPDTSCIVEYNEPRWEGVGGALVFGCAGWIV